MRPRNTKTPIGDYRYSGRVSTVFNWHKLLNDKVSESYRQYTKRVAHRPKNLNRGRRAGDGPRKYYTGGKF